MHTYFTHDMENETPKMKQNLVKWGYDCFQCLLMTGNPYTWSKNANYTLILDHLWIINISKEILRPINRYSNLRKNMKSKAASPLQFYILGIIEVYLNIECFTKINLTANIIPT